MITRRGAARQDLVKIIYRYIEKGSPATARRFREQVEAAFQRLASLPGIGNRAERPRQRHRSLPVLDPLGK